jgi:phosphoribosyl 1,2-cyclic phosphate 1,2-diphosphodiesterase
MIDLHVHSKYSDGSSSVEDILIKSKLIGITHISFTDHDTTKGLDEAFRLSDDYDIEVIPGIELSCYDYKRKKRAHVLGYFIDYKNNVFDLFCHKLNMERNENSLKMIKIIQEAGYKITLNEVEEIAKGGTGIYKQHIMHALINKGYATEVISELHKKLFSRPGKDRPAGIAYMETKYPDVIDGINAIIHSKGIPVLAHPALSGITDAIPEYAEAGLQGVEVKHCKHNPEDEKIISKIADKFNLIKTGGSDFHGFYGEQCEKLGSFDPGIEAVNKLKEKKNKLLVPK